MSSVKTACWCGCCPDYVAWTTAEVVGIRDVIAAKIEVLWFRALRMTGLPATGEARLWHVVRLLGFGWAIAFVVIGVGTRLHVFADGGMFAYGIAVRDSWAFHWHNIPTRAAVWVYAHWPSELLVAATGAPSLGVALYGVLLFSAPLFGLLWTAAVDRSEGRVVLTAASASTALVLPLVFGFPTEMWVSHALFWPCLAMAHGGRVGIGWTVAMVMSMVALMLSHGGGVVFAGLVVASVLLRSQRRTGLMLPLAGLVAGAAVWLTMRLAFPPDAYFANVLGRAALLFLDVGGLGNSAIIAPLLAAAGAVVLALLLRHLRSAYGWQFGALCGAIGLLVYWQMFEPPLLAVQRYPLRTALFLIAPAFAGLAIAWLSRREAPMLPVVGPLRDAVLGGLAVVPRPALAIVVALVTFSHLVETCRFVAAWGAYVRALEDLSSGAIADSWLGHEAFVSAHRISKHLQPLAWQSTTQYLSILVAAGYRPKRLVVDPDAGYYWLSCATARANAVAQRALPPEGRAMVARLSCLHRPDKLPGQGF
ncbi:MAG: hypothetical protein KDJ36_04335 [Hyphomicrobiaceae bacterium]|nr:hypothetical protein [Hyphomicrobiaceae bacterium]